MKRKTRAFGLVVGLAILAASAFYGLHLAGTMLYVRAPWHFMASSTSLPKDELALDLRCPAALTWGETARIQLEITNLRANALDIRVFGTGGDFVLPDGPEDTGLTIPPGETVELDWETAAQRPGGQRFSVFVRSPGSGVSYYSPSCIVPVLVSPEGGAAPASWVGLLGALFGSALCAPWLYRWLRGHRPRGSSVVVAAVVFLDIAILVSMLSYAATLSPT